MSLIIRLSRIGRKGEARFRVVVKEKRSKLTGRAVDTLGTVIRSVGKIDKNIDEEKLKIWQSKGAQLSDSVKKLLAQK